jgi:hypothetical protein
MQGGKTHTALSQKIVRARLSAIIDYCYAGCAG